MHVNHWKERVRQRCLEKSKNLTLEMATDIGRMFEATRDGLQVMSGEDPRVEVNKRAWRNSSSRRSKKPGKPKTHIKENNEQPQKCDRCGYHAHKPQEKCPARNESCKKCRKIGHFAQVCRSRKNNVKESSEEEESPDGNMRLLHVATLKMNGVNDRKKLL